MLNDHYHPRHRHEPAKDTCYYCHRPASWQQVGNEKVCAHCGTRVYSPALTLLGNTSAGKRAER